MSKKHLSPQTKILLIGSEGQVATCMRSVLQDQNNLTQTYYEENSPGKNKYFLDLRNIASISRLIHELKPGVIVNCAAYTAVDLAEKEVKLAQTINSDAPAQMAQAAQDVGSFLIHFSTDYVFDGQGELPFKEDDSCRPLNSYGLSKRRGEENIISTPGLNYIILRTSWVFSAYGHNFLKTMVRLGQEREELSVVDDQIGSPTSANQIALATLAIINTIFQNPEKQKAVSGIYHFCCSGSASWFDFATYIFSLMRKMGEPLKLKKLYSIPTQSYPTPALRPLNSRLNTHKFRETFCFEPCTWQEETRKVLEQIIGPVNNGP